MEYPKRSVNGDSGEYLVAHKITRLFSWPCRLLSVDLGVDAEMEIMDEAGSSTGDIIKIQIKSFEEITSELSKSIYVYERHIDYWKRFCLPVIICCVDLKNEKIYWKQITATESFSSGGESKRIKFCLEHDVLDHSSKNKLNNLACPPESKKITPLFESIMKKAQSLPNHTTVMLCDEEIQSTERQCHLISEELKKIDSLIVHFPWRLSTHAIMKINYVRAEVQRVRVDYNYHRTSLAEGS